MKRILLITSLLFASSLQATLVSYDYFGTVTGLQGQSEPKFGGLVAGDVITGSFSFDTNAINQGDLIHGMYGALSFSLQLGALSYSPSKLLLHVNTNSGYYWWISGQEVGYSMNFDLFDTIAPYLQLDTLRRPPPDLASVNFHFGSMNFLNGNEGEQTHLNYNVNRVVLHPSSVPDSGCTLALIGFSFGALLLLRKRSVLPWGTL